MWRCRQFKIFYLQIFEKTSVLLGGHFLVLGILSIILILLSILRYNIRSLNLPEPLGPPRPVALHLYTTITDFLECSYTEGPVELTFAKQGTAERS